MKKTLITLSIMLIAVSSYGQSMKNRKFDIQKIDSTTYFTAKENANIPEETNLEKITDFEQAKKMLKGRVTWGKYDEKIGKYVENEQGEAVYKILFRNGKTYLYDDSYGIFFIAYYPQEDILLLEGGHCSDVIFNLTTGAKTDDVGNPENIRYSPSKKYRFNSYYSGQAGVYFIQKKTKTQYKTIIHLSEELRKTTDFIEYFIEYFSDAFWQSDTVLFFIVEDSLYYQLILK